MYISPTLTTEEFKTIHNGLCKLRTVVERLENVIHPDLYETLVSSREEIYEGLKNSYELEENYFKKQHNHYEEISEKMNLSSSVWSMYEVKNLLDKHRYGNVDRLIYKENWGEVVQVSIDGDTWAALYRASNEAIKQSGDSHHVFIEDFSVCPEDNRTLYLHTGS